MFSDFVKALPESLVYAAIYRKGAKMPGGKLAGGKNPTKESFDFLLGPADVALAAERNPDIQAVGIFTGIRGKGIVILDVDRNLNKVIARWGDTLQGAPKVTSTKKNAAKYIFRVPEALWNEVEGRGLGDDADYEILWNSKRQGVIYGAYPGGKVSVPGQYDLEGDLNRIPVAPDWLLAEMKQPPKAMIKRDLDFTDRTQDEVCQIINDCLKVIPTQGKGSRDHWVKVGMAIHSALPNDLGLVLWSAWSAEDPDFADEWADGENPCEETWYSFKGSGVGLGTLIWMADRADPERHRFSEDTKKIVKAAEEKKVQEYRQATLDFEEVMRRAKRILDLDNPAEVNYKLNSLALQAGYRDQSSLEKLIVDQIAYEKAQSLMTVEKLMELDEKRGYLIPDVLPHPSVILIYGAGGDGKSTAAWALAKHIATGQPFKVRGADVPIEQGPVLLLNGDQPLIQLKEQLIEADFPITSDTYIQTDWQLQRYAQFIKLMETYKPKLVVIDSLIGCSGGKAFDENKSDFATPLYWLTKNNGDLFPATTILIIHHANKNGGFRGTSAIRDAVDETWSLKRPETDPQKRSKQQQQIQRHERLIEVEKSRSGRSGTHLILGQDDDLNFYISDFTPEMDPDDTAPSSVRGRVLNRLRTAYPGSRSKTDLLADSLISGSAAAIKKSLQRLEAQQLIVSFVPEGSRSKEYKANLARGEGQKMSPFGTYASAGADFNGGQDEGDKPLCPPLMDGAVEIQLTDEERGQL
jgi:RecA-family ATPase